MIKNNFLTQKLLSEINKEQNKNTLVVDANQNYNGEYASIDLEEIIVQSQVRTKFKDEEIQALAQSIKQHGQIQPIVVLPLDSGKFKLVCGEKRYRACRLNAQKTIKAIVLNPNDNKNKDIILQIIENLQRSNPSVMDTANAIIRLREQTNLNIETISSYLNIEKSYIYKLIKFDNLQEHEKDILKDCSFNFIKDYLQLKETNPSQCDKVLKLLENINANLLTEDARADEINVVHHLIKRAIENSKRGQQQSDKTQNYKKTTISWKKIDKICPNLHMQYFEVAQEQGVALEELTATALEFYLEHLQHEKNI